MTEALVDSQMPLVIQQARKEAFFRQRAGATAGSSLSADADDEDSDDPFTHMHKKRRDIYKGTKRAFKNKGYRKIRRQRDQGRPRFFNPKQRPQPTTAERQAEMQRWTAYQDKFKPPT
jgi:hypothetical protein